MKVEETKLYGCNKMNKTEGPPRVYIAISHPLRRRILDIISESGRVGFKDLKSALNISVGAIMLARSTPNNIHARIFLILNFPPFFRGFSRK